MERLATIVKTFPITDNAKRIANGSGIKAKPFIQWVGGKREMIPQYEPFFPENFGTYFEPFLGGGAIYFHLQPRKAVLGDSNLELIKSYEGVRDNPESVIRLLKVLKDRHSAELYSEIRNIDRKINIFEDLTNEQIAARLIYLNQTCFNGVYRVNKKEQSQSSKQGEYNTHYSKSILPASILLFFDE